MELNIYRIDGSETGEKMSLPERVFGIEPHSHAMYMAVRAELTNRRQGTRATKGRSQVRGGGGKPWRQKGTGRARAGTIRSPLWVGGGRAFGPKPHDYRLKLPKKVKQLARRSAFSTKAGEQNILLVEDFNFEKPSTKGLFTILQAFELHRKKVLLLVSKTDGMVTKSGRNIPTLHIKRGEEASTYDILNHHVLLIQRSALLKIGEALG